MIRKLMASGKSFVKNKPLAVNYGIDGLLVLGAMGIVGNNNNLFALRLGASDFHISMLHFIPQMIILFLLIPAGMVTDSLRNKKRIITITLILGAVFFAIVGTSAFIPVYAVYFFLAFVALGSVSMQGLFNLSWQSFFPEVVPEKERNNVLTFRARMTMIVQLILPLVVGAILASIPSNDGKIAAHQAFYVVAAVLLLFNALHFRKNIHATQPAEPKRVSLEEMKIAGARLLKNKPFIIFCMLILFFHMTWHMDWTLFFIVQATYLEMNEFLISLTPVVGMLAQLVTLKFWSKNNVRQGVEFPLLYGMFGLIFSPIAVVVSLALPLNIAPFTFLLIHGLGQLAFANITLNLFQCLLKVVDNENRGFSISVYTCMLTLSNAIMPVVGVAIYRALGADAIAMRNTFIILFFLRIVTASLWFLRLKFQPTAPVGLN